MLRRGRPKNNISPADGARCSVSLPCPFLQPFHHPCLPRNDPSPFLKSSSKTSRRTFLSFLLWLQYRRKRWKRVTKEGYERENRSSTLCAKFNLTKCDGLFENSRLLGGLRQPPCASSAASKLRTQGQVVDERVNGRERQRVGGWKVCDIGLVSRNTPYSFLFLPLPRSRSHPCVTSAEGGRQHGGEVCNWRNICGLRGGINVCSPRRFTALLVFPPRSVVSLCFRLVVAVFLRSRCSSSSS